VRIVVFSDSHGSYRSAESVILKNKEASIFVHLGDGERDVSALRAKYPELDIRSVSGNCDFLGEPCPKLIIDTEYARILCVHGHRHGVKSGLEFLRADAVEDNCAVALFGHTHSRLLSYSNGIYFMNPGSCSVPRDGKPRSYGYIDLTEAGIFTGIADLKSMDN